MRSEPTTRGSEVLGARPQRVRPVALATVASVVGADAVEGDVTVSGVTLRSQSVRPDDLYAALPGARTHGARYAADAADRGAVAFLTDPTGAGTCRETGRPVLVVEGPRDRLGEVASVVYGSPSDRIATLGVTGTQGKTTVTFLTEAGLRGVGATAAVVGTTGTRIAGRPVKSTLTTPEAPDLHALLAVMVEQGVDACAMEVSSHALIQGRVDGVVFDVATFLNLGRDHLDFHGDMASYFEAKAALFTPERARRAVVDIDDDYGRRLVERLEIPYSTLSTDGADADWRAERIEATAQGTAFDVIAPDGGRHDVRLPLVGTFNVANALAALASLVAVGYPIDAVIQGLADCPSVPGRMESVDAGQSFAAIVDYAHKPDALRAVLTSLRPLTTGRILLVIGAGGDRDAGKRPLMGEVAAAFADVVVVTDDNPRTETPAAIRSEVLAGARASGSSTELVEIGDRRKAIRLAVSSAHDGDCVVVAGKGHETGQEIDGVVHPFDDVVELRAALEERLGPDAESES
ncbi:MAG TPA: UDP-N-acetylmuramoyl-L-alanyl-D-glutamate--2,6-diaminopimelate ligase [Nocardioidaceae bacterium]|nr:UDP-N-acetylmuramoyl-L-alanyl-D-glutamate--2,6-diaminopimelate ligase [Nocardioidaceae bacterium]